MSAEKRVRLKGKDKQWFLGKWIQWTGKKKKVGKRHFAVVPSKKKVNGKHNFLTWLESMSRRKYQALWLKWKQSCKEWIVCCVIGSNWQLLYSVQGLPQPAYCELLSGGRFCLATPLANIFSISVANPTKTILTRSRTMSAVLQTKIAGWDVLGEVPGTSSAACVINVSSAGVMKSPGASYWWRHALNCTANACYDLQFLSWP